MGCTSSSKLEEKNSKVYSPAESSSGSPDSKMAGKNTLGVTGNTQFPSFNSQQRISGSQNKTRTKVALKPGRSLMDWIRLGNSGKDLTGQGGKGKIEVTQEELEKHNKLEDAWTLLRGKVYNITPYLEYHPGGEEELMRGAGKDGTELFDEIHKWVNYESMLEKCFIGKMKTVTPASKRGSLASTSPKSLKAPVLNGPSIQQLAPPSGPSPPSFDWYQNDSTVTMVIYTRWKDMKQEHVIIHKTGNLFQAALYIEQSTYFIHLELENSVTDEYDVKIQSQSGKTEITLLKDKQGQQWSGMGKFLENHGKFIPVKDIELHYRKCFVDSVSQITHDSKLLCVRLPQGCCMHVPIGYHVHVRHTVSGMEIVRSYTVVLPSIDTKSADMRETQGKVFYLMIKVYKEGALTPWIDTLKPGDEIECSQYDGNFQSSQLSACSELVMYAAGTGFTPMVRLINHCLSDTSQTRKVKLMFFNKKERDIIWREHLDSLANKYDWFTVKYVLSEADDSWTGAKGRVSRELMEGFSPQNSQSTQSLICACGPTPFTNTVIQLAKDLGYKDEHCHAFLG